MELGGDRYLRRPMGVDVFRAHVDFDVPLQVVDAPGLREIAGVDPSLESLEGEGVLGNLRHRHAIGGVLEAARIGVGAEQVHAAVVTLVGLQALKNFLGVVQDGAGRIDLEVGACLDLGLVPAALGLIVADDRHVIGEDPPEAGVHQPGDAVLLGRWGGCGLDVEFHAHVLASRCRWRCRCGTHLP